MKLTELEPEFMKIVDEKTYRRVDSINDADGVMFSCPKCYREHGNSLIGVHKVLCWNPNVPQTVSPMPGRWKLRGTGFNDLSLVAGSSSVLLTSGCRWHGFVTNGEVTDA